MLQRFARYSDNLESWEGFTYNQVEVSILRLCCEQNVKLISAHSKSKTIDFYNINWLLKLRYCFTEPGEKRKRVPKQFTEGWVEFQKKKVAKEVALKLNNTKIGTRKKSRYYDMIWNIKYIPRFKWVHLSERLAYERAAYKQRLRAEISQAKKEAHYLQTNVEKSKKMKKRKAAEE